MAIGKRRALDHFRRAAMLERRHQDLKQELETRWADEPDLGAAIDDDLDDDLPRLTFIACHSELSKEARVAVDADQVAARP
jgi:RNA polymerase sigma-70 factor (ECF subfamily)